MCPNADRQGWACPADFQPLHRPLASSRGLVGVLGSVVSDAGSTDASHRALCRSWCHTMGFTLGPSPSIHLGLADHPLPAREPRKVAGGAARSGTGHNPISRQPVDLPILRRVLRRSVQRSVRPTQLSHDFAHLGVHHRPNLPLRSRVLHSLDTRQQARDAVRGSSPGREALRAVPGRHQLLASPQFSVAWYLTAVSAGDLGRVSLLCTLQRGKMFRPTPFARIGCPASLGRQVPNPAWRHYLLNSVLTQRMGGALGRASH